MSMRCRLSNFVIILLVLSSLVKSQEIRQKTPSENKPVEDSILGISFSRIGKVEKVDSSDYRIFLNTTKDGSTRSAIARVSVSPRLFVDLPGTYGGRLYLDSPSARRLLKDRVHVDTVKSDSMEFTREYWTVYAGMGAWECVINCYTQEAGRYYILSFSDDKLAGKPGQYAGGKRLTAQKLKARLLRSLQNTTNAGVQQFNELIKSFRINK